MIFFLKLEKIPFDFWKNGLGTYKKLFAR